MVMQAVHCQGRLSERAPEAATPTPGTEWGLPGERALPCCFHKDTVRGCVSNALVCSEGKPLANFHKAAVWCCGLEPILF